MTKAKVGRPRKRSRGTNRIGDTLRSLRVASELTHQQVAKRFGASPSRMGQIETAQQGQPQLDVTVRYARACGYRLMLMFIPDELVPLPPDDEPITCVVPRGDK